MNRDKLFLTREQCKHLTELGLDMSDAIFIWRRQVHGPMLEDTNIGRWKVSFNEPLIGCGWTKFEAIYTYSLQEILKKLPRLIEIGNDSYVLNHNYNNVWYDDEPAGIPLFYTANYEEKNLMKSAYETLCWILENKNKFDTIFYD